MKRAISVFSSTFAALLAATMARAGDSAPFPLDTRTVPLVADSIDVTYDASWVGGDASAMVAIRDNGAEVRRTTGAGEFTHTPTGTGRHELTYTTIIDGVAQDEVYRAVVFKDWKYEVAGGGATITSTALQSGAVSVPAEIDGYPVTGIAASAFSDCDGLTSLTIPNSVTNIANGAFGGCDSLALLTLPPRFSGKTSNMGIPGGCEVSYHGFCDLTIISAYGQPVPQVGSRTIEVFTPTNISCHVNGIHETDSPGVRHVCTGWTGTGSVPARGTGTNVTFSIVEDSTITWNWKRQNRISVSVSGAGSCAFGTQWLDDGTTASATLVLPETTLHAVFLSGDTEGVVLDGATLSIPSDKPRAVGVLLIASNAVEGEGAPFSWTAGDPEARWSIVADADTADGYVLRSDEIEAGGTAAIVATVDGPGRLDFDWRISANRGDYARVYVDGVQVAQITRNTAWAHASVAVDGVGPHTVRWEYEHRASAAANDNAAFLDNVAWHPTPPMTLAEALDGEEIAWVTDDGAEWTAQLTVTSDGEEDAAVSGPVDNAGVSGLETTVTGSGTLAWKWKLAVDDVAGLDVIVDGDFGNPARTYEVPGEWADDSLAFEDGRPHTVRFEFWNLGSSPSDCAYLDCVSWTPEGGGETQTETSTTPEPVPYSWLDAAAAAILAEHGGDYEAAGNAMALNGRTVWECYVADLDPEDKDSDLVAEIAFDENGKPVVSIAKGKSPNRKYTTQGARSLGGTIQWDDLEEGADWAAQGYRFFKVKVELP